MIDQHVPNSIIAVCMMEFVHAELWRGWGLMVDTHQCNKMCRSDMRGCAVIAMKFSMTGVGMDKQRKQRKQRKLKLERTKTAAATWRRSYLPHLSNHFALFSLQHKHHKHHNLQQHKRPTWLYKAVQCKATSTCHR